MVAVAIESARSRALSVFSLRALFVAFAAALLAACSAMPREQFTALEQAQAEIPGFPNVRFWSDAPPEDLRRSFSKRDMERAVRAEGRFDLLAISGGAYDGAYGAGVITGWTRAGSRPKFTIVTGVSAGALIAPLAFLGPDYDRELARAFVGMGRILDESGVLSIFSSSDARRQTLAGIISEFVDRKLLAAIAREHAKGRRLLVVTTNLDAQRGVVWDMGAIASSRHPDARRLFIDVLTASSSVPGVFAPTYIPVVANGRVFREMHVDGGATTQVFTLPEAVLAEGMPRRDVIAPSTIWVVVNNRLSPDFEVVQGSLFPSVGRSFSTLIKMHARSNILATKEFARANGIKLNLTAIDEKFVPAAKPGFNAAYMSSLFEYGHRRAVSGSLWEKSVPLAAPVRRPAAPASGGGS